MEDSVNWREAFREELNTVRPLDSNTQFDLIPVPADLSQESQVVEVDEWFYVVEPSQVTRVSPGGETVVISRPGQTGFTDFVYHREGVNYFSFDSGRYLLRLPGGEIEPRSFSHYVTMPSDEGWGRWKITPEGPWYMYQHIINRTRNFTDEIPNYIWKGKPCWSSGTLKIYNICNKSSTRQVLYNLRGELELFPLNNLPTEVCSMAVMEYQGLVHVFLEKEGGVFIARQTRTGFRVTREAWFRMHPHLI